MEKYISRDQMKVILQQAPKEVNKGELLKTYADNGFVMEGINEPKTVIDQAKDVGVGFAKGAGRTLLNTAQGIQTIGQGAMMATGNALGIDGTNETVAQTGFDSLDTSQPEGQALEQSLQPTNTDQKLGGQLELVGEALAGGGASLIKNAVVGGSKILTKGIKPVADAIKSTADEALFSPTTEEATKHTLNPFINPVAEVSIPVKSIGGETKYVVKKAQEATPEEVASYKDEVQGLYSKFTEQGRKFLKDRSVDGGSPVEQVGDNIDKYVRQVDELRKSVGKQMGKIEKASDGIKVPFNQTETVQNFVLDTAEALKKSGTSYGIDNGLTKEVSKLSEDILKLEKNGGSAKETLDFTRKWANYIENQKDKFGDFKENKFANSQIEKVVTAIKNSARNSIAENNETYKTLIQGYRKTSQFKDEAKRLLGQDGLYGSSIKGAATAKRAVQSNSDAGSRQFLKMLRDITGYDGIKEADLALKAMKDVGDYQGLSLLGVLNEAQGGIVNTVKHVAKKLTPSEATRTKKYINK